MIDQGGCLQQGSCPEEEDAAGENGPPGDVHVVVGGLHHVTYLEPEPDAYLRFLDHGKPHLDGRQDRKGSKRPLEG